MFQVDGCTCLHVRLAALNGHLEVAQILVNAGDNMNAPRVAGDTALHFALINSHLELVRLSIQALKVVLSAESGDKNCKCRWQTTYAFCNWVGPATSSPVAEAGADVAQADGKGYVHFGALQRHFEIVQLLIHAGTDPTVSIQSNEMAAMALHFCNFDRIFGSCTVLAA